MKKSILAFLILAAAGPACMADDGSWGTSFREAAGPIYAETENPDIALESEFLRFSHSSIGETEAFFLFRNTAGREVRLEAGFPVRVRIRVGRLETTPAEAGAPETVLYPTQGKYRNTVDGLEEMKAFYGAAMFLDKVPHPDAEDPELPNPLWCVREKEAAVRRMVEASAFTDPFSFHILQDGRQVDYDAVLLESSPPSPDGGYLELVFHFHHVLAFGPNASSLVRIGYYQNDLRGTRNRLYCFANEYGWDYVLGTGSTWKGPIGRLLLALPREAEPDLPDSFVSLGTQGPEQLFLAEDYEPGMSDEISLAWSVEDGMPASFYGAYWFGDPPVEAVKPIMPADYFVTVLGASSSLAERTTVYTPQGVMQNIDFAPLRAFDGIRESAWCEAAGDDGIGEWIDFELSEDVEGLTVQNGFNMSLTAVEGRTIDTYYGKNNRVKSMEIASRDGKLSRTIGLADTKDLQELDLALPAGRYRLTIRSVYKGSKWSDTCLGELTFRPVNEDLKELLAKDAFLREHF